MLGNLQLATMAILPLHVMLSTPSIKPVLQLHM